MLLSDLLLKNNAEKQRKFYQGLFKKHGAVPQALHWNSKQNQDIRFELFVNHFEDGGKASILDIGCGLGCFYEYLQRREIVANYTGYDIVEEFVEYCKQTFPTAEFKKKNVLLESELGSFDYVVSSGIFAFSNRIFLKKMLKTAFALSKKAYIFNIVIDANDSRFLEISKAELLRLCKSVSPAGIELSDGYLENDLTIALIKR